MTQKEADLINRLLRNTKQAIIAAYERNDRMLDYFVKEHNQIVKELEG